MKKAVCICQVIIGPEVQHDFFLLSLILASFMEQVIFHVKLQGILPDNLSLDNLALSFPCVAFYVFLFLLSIQGNTCMAAILLESSLHCLF
jgi:hypothetical protein